MVFVSFLLGTLIVSSLMLLMLLLAPKPMAGIESRRIPIVSAALAILLMALGFIGGISLAG